ncbi:methyltransferase [Candidatus Woesearchaeota archaeon]|nr:methyltransferase [Candidatus Woesearchaeota archaeon]
MDKIPREALVRDLEAKLQHGDYVSSFFDYLGVDPIFIGRGTLGPEQSWVAQHFTEYLVLHPHLYRGKDVLDMGTGSGVQGVVVARGGAKNVVAVDKSLFALRSARRNARGLENMRVVKSNLFDSLPLFLYDVIIFNHPFLEGTPKDDIQGIYITEPQTLERFFDGSRSYLSKGGMILMPFSRLGDHPPERYIRRFGYRVTDQVTLENQFGNHSISVIQQ